MIILLLSSVPSYSHPTNLAKFSKANSSGDDAL